MKRKVLPMVKDCDGCGACCTEQAALPCALVADDPCVSPASPLPDSLKDELRATVQRFMRDGWPPDGSPCIWYDAATKRCQHHEHRPDICVDIKVGGRSCLAWRREKGIDKQARYVMKNGRLVKEKT